MFFSQVDRFHEFMLDWPQNRLGREIDLRWKIRPFWLRKRWVSCLKLIHSVKRNFVFDYCSSLYRWIQQLHDCKISLILNCYRRDYLPLSTHLNQTNINQHFILRPHAPLGVVRTREVCMDGVLWAVCLVLVLCECFFSWKTVVALFLWTDSSCDQGDVNWDKENVLVEV